MNSVLARIIVTCMCNIHFNINLFSHGDTFFIVFKKSIAFNDSLLVNTNNHNMLFNKLFIPICLQSCSSGVVIYKPRILVTQEQKTSVLPFNFIKDCMCFVFAHAQPLNKYPNTILGYQNNK